jgi:4-deoxy-L-threo-5-hexosulose-uronate ketol-isomerase
MDIRYSTGKEAFKHMTTEELRKEFLVQNIFKADDVSAVYSHIDRIVTLGAMPVAGKLDLAKNIDPMKDFGVNYFLERRELGIINIGGDGVVEANGVTYNLVHFDGLYLPMGTKEVTLASKDAKNPAKFYMSCTPAHRAFPAKHIVFADAKHVPAGSAADSNKRTINQYIHPMYSIPASVDGFDPACRGKWMEHDARPNPREAHGSVLLLCHHGETDTVPLLWGTHRDSSHCSGQ